MTTTHLLMAASLVSALALAGCGSSSEPAANRPPAGSIPGAKEVSKESRSPDEDGAVLSAAKAPTIDPRKLDQDIPATPVKEVSAEALSADLNQLTNTEKSLEAFGLKFKSEKMASGRQGLNWDYAFMDEKEAAGVSIYDAIAPLTNYVKVAYNFVDKWDHTFTVNGSTTTSVRLMNTKMPELATKIQIIEKTISDLKANLAKEQGKQKQSRRSTRTQVA